jgi:hypothetical protein
VLAYGYVLAASTPVDSSRQEFFYKIHPGAVAARRIFVASEKEAIPFVHFAPCCNLKQQKLGT